ncbi:MAG: hypothetical protein GY797_39470 [Deltaproteobacteria bacterium]|nr:hypothetical protein [Deltaproteobacteria bacterium]
MPVIKNCLNQPFALFLSTGKSVQLAAKGTAKISDEEAELPEIQRLVARRDVRIVAETKTEVAKKKEKKTEATDSPAEKEKKSSNES